MAKKVSLQLTKVIVYMFHKLVHLSHIYINLKPNVEVYISNNILLMIYTPNYFSQVID
jgi:hypothetical protein